MCCENKCDLFTLKKILLILYNTDEAINLYCVTRKIQFSNEHFLFCTNFYIRKLYICSYWYIDVTFSFPPGFGQFIVKLYLDDDIKIISWYTYII